jgi:hypothetical protein
MVAVFSVFASLQAFGGYESLGSLRVPTTAEATWVLPDGPFTYFRGRLRALEVFAV